MPTQNISTFSSFTLTEQEQLAGTVLSYEQKLVIQNQLCMIAEEKLTMQVDPQNYSSYIQQEAFKAGQITALKYLLDSSLASEAAILEKAATPLY